jgi:hypothetical protein
LSQQPASSGFTGLAEVRPGSERGTTMEVHVRFHRTRAIAGAAALMAAAAAVVWPTSPATAAGAVPAAATISWRADSILDAYHICLDAENDAGGKPNRDGDRVQVWECNAQAQQGWHFWELSFDRYYVQNDFAGLCLDAENDGASSPYNWGDKVQLWTCNGQEQQIWRLTSTGMVNDLSGLYLEAEDDALLHPWENGDGVRLWGDTTHTSTSGLDEVWTPVTPPPL